MCRPLFSEGPGGDSFSLLLCISFWNKGGGPFSAGGDVVSMRRADGEEQRRHAADGRGHAADGWTAKLVMACQRREKQQLKKGRGEGVLAGWRATERKERKSENEIEREAGWRKTRAGQRKLLWRVEGAFQRLQRDDN